MNLIIHTDGGARGNPGPAAVGVVIGVKVSKDNEESIITAFGKRIGETTNNVAEYTAVVEALMYVNNFQTNNKSEHFKTIDIYLDSLLVVQQLNGLFKVKDSRLRELLQSVRMLEQDIDSVIRYHHVPREHNLEADALVNEALDA